TRRRVGVQRPSRMGVGVVDGGRRGRRQPMTQLDGKRSLITGPTGQVAKPVALALAKSNEVIGIARFNDAAAREQLEAAGVQCIKVDLAQGDFSAVPTDVDYVLNLAVTKTQDFDNDIAANV